MDKIFEGLCWPWTVHDIEFYSYIKYNIIFKLQVLRINNFSVLSLSLSHTHTFYTWITYVQPFYIQHGVKYSILHLNHDQAGCTVENHDQAGFDCHLYKLKRTTPS